MKSLAGGFWRLSPWLARLILAWAVLGFGQVAWTYLTDPVGSALNSDIALNSVGAVSHIRVVFGGFHLTFALIALFCFLSRERVLTGLLIAAVVITVAVAIRLTGIAIEGTTPRLFSCCETRQRQCFSHSSAFFSMGLVGSTYC